MAGEDMLVKAVYRGGTEQHGWDTWLAAPLPPGEADGVFFRMRPLKGGLGYFRFRIVNEDGTESARRQYFPVFFQTETFTDFAIRYDELTPPTDAKRARSAELVFRNTGPVELDLLVSGLGVFRAPRQ